MTPAPGPRIVIGGGGTAGHVFPALAVARVLADRHGADVRFVGTDRGLEATLVPAAGFPFTGVEARPFLRRVSPAALRAPFALLRSLRRCREVVAGADAVLGMGGYASGPVVVAALRARRPVVLHEQNALPGLANRWFARFARCTALSFAEAAKHLPRRARTVVTGNPVREEILRVREERDALAKEALGDFRFDEARRTIVAFGGSQGALHLDRALAGAFGLLRDRADLQVLLLTGRAHHDEIRSSLPVGGALVVRTRPFLERMELAYAIADVVVARSGATTVAEVTACGIPALLVPYPYATGQHQEANARSVQRAGGATVLLDDQLEPDVLAERILSLVDHRERLEAMAERSAAFGRPAAAERVADLVMEAASG
jgi:UDP-N-acetylglucosamine--N-acetylmuramyl-(pentapeptide) pyrophosphoryl-undecaprenol N-acetylglucosamine transferase